MFNLKIISLLIKPLTKLDKWRCFPLYELISYFFMFASVPILAFGINEYKPQIINVIIFTVITLYSGFFAALIWNDITDADIDSIAHPDRAIPNGVISKKRFFIIALFFSATTFIFALLVSPWCLILVGFTALFVTFHDKYLKKKVKIPAYSEIFTPVQWLTVVIFGFFAIWSALPADGSINLYLPLLGYISFNPNELYNMLLLVLFTYFADDAHDIPEGIHDYDGDKKAGVRTYATSFGIKNASKISFFMFLISGLFGILLFFRTILSFIFLIPFIIIWVYILSWSYKLIKTDKKNIKKVSSIVGRKGFDFLLISFDLIFLDVLIQVLFFY